ncbi:MAG: hypothetical protein EBZ69_03820 [Alphaproteobacteria bacterium]|nr:hypothetical protein [Alphaproteobacteria bacterium]NDC55927.1 hypothetical protein [Alphaproteobacteria bacterium]NDG04407.1 hypothetical protein [Alphaproteobacteria bacterium]
MENLGLWLSLLTGIVLVLFLGPNIFRFNQGKILQNVALWLGIFVLLGWFYKLFGPFGTVAETPMQRQDQPQTEEQSPNPNDRPADTFESLSKPL